jgi:hypothetical protein
MLLLREHILFPLHKQHVSQRGEVSTGSLVGHSRC